MSLLRIANVPARGLSDVTMERLLAASQERHASVYSAMRHTDVLASFAPKTRESIQAFTHLLDHTRSPLQGSAPLSLSTWAERWLAGIGYIEDIRRGEKNRETADNRVRNLKELVADLDGGSGEAASPRERLAAFLEDLALDQDREEDETEAGDAVTLITMHSCKGLEFPHVYVTGVEDGLIPHSRSKVEGTLDEERRLFYVAMTRAMETLSLSYCLGRKKYGQVMPCHPSPFLAELPKELVEDANARAKQPVSVAAGKSLFAAMKAAIR